MSGTRTSDTELSATPNSAKEDNADIRLLPRRKRTCLGAPALAASITLNIILALGLALLYLFSGGFVLTYFDRSRMACSGNGMLFQDASKCMCFDCYVGEACEEMLNATQCVVNANGGTVRQLVSIVWGPLGHALCS